MLLIVRSFKSASSSSAQGSSLHKLGLTSHGLALQMAAGCDRFESASVMVQQPARDLPPIGTNKLVC